MHEMWITGDGMMELPCLFTLKNLKTEKISTEALLERISEI